MIYLVVLVTVLYVIFTLLQLLTLFSAKSKCTFSFRLNKIPLSSNKDPPNVTTHLTDASKLFKVHFMFKLKVGLEVCSVCYITGNCSQKYGNTAISKMSKFPSFDYALDEK